MNGSIPHTHFHITSSCWVEWVPSAICCCRRHHRQLRIKSRRSEQKKRWLNNNKISKVKRKVDPPTPSIYTNTIFASTIESNGISIKQILIKLKKHNTKGRCLPFWWKATNQIQRSVVTESRFNEPRFRWKVNIWHTYMQTFFRRSTIEICVRIKKNVLTHNTRRILCKTGYVMGQNRQVI